LAGLAFELIKAIDPLTNPVRTAAKRRTHSTSWHFLHVSLSLEERRTATSAAGDA
jgi:hypothetical protein